MARATRKAEALEAKALALTRATSTKILVASFLDTDAILDAGGLTPDGRMEIVEARGWIMTVLEERGELALIGCE